MHRYPHSRSAFGAAITVFALALLSSAPALAASSSTLYRPGDTIKASTQPVTVTVEGIIPVKCSLNGGSFKVPSSPTNHNAAGAVASTYSTLPTYTECLYEGKTDLTITTSGTWTLDTQYGEATGSVVIPTGGLTWTLSGDPSCSNTSPVTFTGAWNNGFPSGEGITTGASTAFTDAGHVTGSCGGSSKEELAFGAILETLTDTTHPTQVLPLLGP